MDQAGGCELGEREEDVSQSRILQWREKLRESASGSKKYIFQHLRTKAVHEPSNLVVDHAGQIVYNPADAMQTIINTWDDIFSANVLHDDPSDMLRVIWPYMDHDIQPWHLPPLTGSEIPLTIRNRWRPRDWTDGAP